MKDLTNMKERDLSNLLKAYRVIMFQILTYNKEEKEDNCGFEISPKRLFNKVVHKTLNAIHREKTDNYEDYGFKFIECVISVANYDYDLFIETLNNKVRLIENVKKELNQLSKIQNYYKDFNNVIKELNEISDRQFMWSINDDGRGMFTEFYFMNGKTKKVRLKKEEERYVFKKDLELNFNQKAYLNFLAKYDSLYDELELTKIFKFLLTINIYILIFKI